MNINFLRVVGNPQVNGIEIIGTGGGGGGSGARVAGVPTEEKPLPDEEIAMDVFPNPFHDKINLGFNREKVQAQISLVDISGRTFYQEIQDHVSPLTVDFSGVSIPNGIYILVVKLDGKKFSRRVLKE